MPGPLLPIALSGISALSKLFGKSGSPKTQTTERTYDVFDPRLYEFNYDTRGAAEDSLLQFAADLSGQAGADGMGFLNGGGISIPGGGASAGAHVSLAPASQLDLSEDIYDPHRVSEGLLSRGSQYLRGQSNENLRLLNDRLALAGVDTNSPVAMYLAEKQQEALGQQQDQLYGTLLESNINRRAAGEQFNTDYLNKFKMEQGQLDESYQGRVAQASGLNAQLRQRAAEIAGQLGLGRSELYTKLLQYIINPSDHAQALDSKTVTSGGGYNPSGFERLLSAAPDIVKTGVGIYNRTKGTPSTVEV